MVALGLAVASRAIADDNPAASGPLSRVPATDLTAGQAAGRG
ncbi:hypothetical protein ACFPOI_30995 [Nonomuraea angiospora]|uniref:Uncharacterized protein n=1 Tax=Nonomuraea angiospora TaxID=46172 RepID=A0ABR9LV36_9ACTN|nr:hypothetical protein [Nonomuraea angiospora]MBE1584506.1 hypothetical protein [Nonomuraea angiospora]